MEICCRIWMNYNPMVDRSEYKYWIYRIFSSLSKPKNIGQFFPYYCIFSQRTFLKNLKGGSLAKFLEGKIQKMQKKNFKKFYCPKSFFRSYRSFIYSDVSNRRWGLLFIIRHFFHISTLIRDHLLLIMWKKSYQDFY